MRAAESGGKTVLPKGQVRAEPLPSRLYPVSRVPKSHQLKKQRREAKKRNRQRSQTKARREQRAREQAAQQAEKRACPQERQARRQAQQVEKLARQQEKQEQREAREAARLSRRQEKQMPPQENREQGRIPQRLAGKPMGQQPLLHPSDGHRQAPETPEPPGPGSSQSPLSDTPPREGPLLRLSRGRLQPPHRLMRKKIRYKGDHGPASCASP
jgi:hypothetical protein